MQKNFFNKISFLKIFYKIILDINYYHCKKIIDILKETEINSKNLFGQYTSQRMKDWVEIVKLYEKDNIYLGEVASLLQRTVSYEVPALKKQISKIATLQTVSKKCLMIFFFLFTLFKIKKIFFLQIFTGVR
mgnify:CR=1 FL=1